MEAAERESAMLDRIHEAEGRRAAVEAQLEATKDELSMCWTFVKQLRLENTQKWRCEERNDWKALTDSIQADRRKLQMENTRLQTQLKNQGIGYSDVDAPRPELPTTRVSPGDADRRRRAPAVTPQAKAAAKGRHVQQKDVAATLSRRQGPPAPRPFSLSALVSAVWASQRKRQRTSVLAPVLSV
ncbi:hypothetical protein M885DRAFT_524491 [Pelagophyceae sp. CCMP2097]|nr:hypothetical protein M885DRAFT_524491 [Pelagophyceae sp. CCMP2097]|mmetsp:Transcript_22752/g.76920  ORF Transcript_22752/g.76920 Transcript_22752/m.76920 type:complete len:185 (-) Transcript_22752:73-627(-)